MELCALQQGIVCIMCASRRRKYKIPALIPMRVHSGSELYVLGLLFHMEIGISFRPVVDADTTQSIR